MTEEKKAWDVFVSHASEDKGSLVRSLATSLRSFGAKVWYDEFTLLPGSSLSRSIDRGLADSRFGVVVISPSFFSKGWPEYELSGLTARDVGRRSVIIPIWHNVTKEDVLKYSPPLADKKAIVVKGMSVQQIAVQVLEVIRPDLFTRVLKRLAFAEFLKNAKSEVRDPRTIEPGPIRHNELPPDLVGRIRLIRAALWGVYTHSMDFWLDGFKRDAHPSKEVAWWEHVAACYAEVSKLTPLNGKEQKKTFSLIFALCSGISEQEVAQLNECIPADAVEKILMIVKYRLPVYDINDPFPCEMSDLSDELTEMLPNYDIEHFPSR